MIKDDVVVDTGETTWEGVLEAGTYILAVLDDEQGEGDGVIRFGVELNRTVLLQTDENGAATGTPDGRNGFLSGDRPRRPCGNL